MGNMIKLIFQSFLITLFISIFVGLLAAVATFLELKYGEPFGWMFILFIVIFAAVIVALKLIKDEI